MSNSRNRSTFLVVDDEPHARTIISEFLDELGYRSVCAENGKVALKVLQDGEHEIDVVLSDLNMPEMDGLALLKAGGEKFPDLDFIMMTANGTIESAIQAIKLGAYDYLTKPIELDDLSLRLQQLYKMRNLRARTEHLERENKNLRTTPEWKSNSPVMKQLLEELDTVSGTDATILLLGETGVGKEVLARRIHESSSRAKGPFVAVNCSAIPENLMESEFFGHEKGSFTGADRKADGYFHQAHGGTLFLDEIGEMDIKLQPKILRALEERKVRRVGGRAEQEVDVRLVAATHQNIDNLVREGRFREDLYFRLNVVKLNIPPLRDRREDIRLMVPEFVHRYQKKLKCKVERVDESFYGALKKHLFPGNVRELANIVERAMIYASGEVLTVDNLPADLHSGAISGKAHKPLILKIYGLGSLLPLGTDSWNESRVLDFRIREVIMGTELIRRWNAIFSALVWSCLVTRFLWRDN